MLYPAGAGSSFWEYLGRIRKRHARQLNVGNRMSLVTREGETDEGEIRILRPDLDVGIPHMPRSVVRDVICENVYGRVDFFQSEMIILINESSEMTCIQRLVDFRRVPQ